MCCLLGFVAVNNSLLWKNGIRQVIRSGVGGIGSWLAEDSCAITCFQLLKVDVPRLYNRLYLRQTQLTNLLSSLTFVKTDYITMVFV